jgi:putative oxidoreductase
MDVVFLIGRVLFVAIFATSVPRYFTARDAMVDRAKTMGAPIPEIAVPLAGTALLVGSALIVLGLWADIGALLLVAFLISVTYYMHRYWKIDDPQKRQMQEIQFNKNISLLGAAIIIFYLYNQGQDLPASLSNALLGRF